MTLADWLSLSSISLALLVPAGARADEQASGNAGCDRDGCHAAGEAGVSCTIAAPGSGAADREAAWLLPLAAVAVAAARGTRRRA